jgi:WD40 repeat protein
VHRWIHGTGAAAFGASADGCFGVSGTQNRRLCVRDLQQMRRKALLPHQTIGQNSTVLAAAITPDGKRALAGGNDQLIRGWDWQRKRCIATFVGEDFTTCAAAAGNDTFVAGSRNGAVRVLKLMPGTADSAVLSVTGKDGRNRMPERSRRTSTRRLGEL